MFLCSAALVQHAIDQRRRKRERMKAVDELMYFPSGTLLGILAGEYRSLLADYAWLQVVQYAGSHMNLPDQVENYAWLGRAIQIIGELDPHFVQPYVFGAQLLGWDGKQPRDAIALLRRGFEANSMDWELPFQAGFIAYERLKDYESAGHYFDLAARLPGVWLIAPRMAAAAYARAGNFELTRELWTQVLNAQPNPKVRDIAQRQLVELMKDELLALQTAVDSFVQGQARQPAGLREVRDLGYIVQIPVEPFGGSYYLSAGRVLDTNLEDIRLTIRSLQRLVERYRRERPRSPTNLEDLVRAGYLPEIPAEPFGGSYDLTAGNVRTTSDLSWAGITR